MTAPEAALSSAVRSLRRLSLFASFALALAALAASATGCRKKSDVAAETAPEPPVVNDATTGLLLTWVDDKGEFHTEQRVSEVPAGGRDVVRVRDPGHEPLSGERIFVADLRTVGTDGSYPVRVVPSGDFEDLAVTRRAKHGIVLAPHGAASAVASARAGAAQPGAVAASPAVIIYGASWCGPCHQAAAYLKQRGVVFVEHDIEKDSSAAREMQGKLAKAGVRGGSIPVLDVRGRILIGFDARAVDQALGPTAN